ncbi:MAG: hypothetical protein NTV19_09060 [Burkholderiales bacterium]|nr:hypothetical protein [Burkholderiales bacterium]
MALSGSIRITVAQAPASTPASMATVTPGTPAKGSSAGARRSCAITGQPSPDSRRTMGRPVWPMPMNPIGAFIASLFSRFRGVLVSAPAR